MLVLVVGQQETRGEERWIRKRSCGNERHREGRDVVGFDVGACCLAYIERYKEEDKE